MRYFPIHEYEQRWQRVHAAMRARGVDLALVWSRSAGTYDRCADLLYLANYYGNQPGQGRRGPAGFAAALVRLDEPPELFADIAEPPGDIISTPVFHGHDDTVEAVGEALSRLGEREVLLVGSDIVPMKYWSRLQTLAPGIRWRIDDELIRSVRLIKSARELDAFREAGRIVSGALDTLMKELVSGRSEAEAAGEAARAVFAGGGHVHMLPVNHGLEMQRLASNPLAGFSHTRPAKGDLVRGWITGPMFQGYWLGPGRTAVCGGKPSPAQRELLEGNARAVDEVIKAVRAGVTVRNLVAVGDRQHALFGGADSELARQWPLYGHGNGLFFEAPTISTKVGPDADFVLAENMVISIEMFFERPGVGTAGFENCVIVKSSGAERLSTTPTFYD
jgi:Xaa-Pro aminopeptidase